MAGLDRRKSVMVDTDQMGLGILSGLAISYGTSGNGLANPAVDQSSQVNVSVNVDMDINLNNGSCSGEYAVTMPLSSPSAMSQLSETVRKDIPRFVGEYWNLVDPMLLLVHRPSYEAAPEDALTCAMAAVATQYLDNKDDRQKGTQLHDVAQQEIKRVSALSHSPRPPSLQVC